MARSKNKQKIKRHRRNLKHKRRMRRKKLAKQQAG